MEQHLSLAEARELTGKSESTIKRKVHDVTSDSGHPDRALILPSPDEVERRRTAREPYAWRVNRSLLLRWFPPEESSTGPKSRVGESQNTASAEVVIQVLREQLQSKDQQIETLSKQLDRKDEQILALNDRQHEFNILMQGLQQRLAITAPRTVDVDSDLDSSSKPSPANRETSTPLKKKKAVKQKRGWFGLLRRSK